MDLKPLPPQVAESAPVLPFNRFIQDEPSMGEALIRRLRTGYPAALVKQAGEYFKVPEKRLCDILGVSASTLHRRTTRVASLDPAASERMHRIAMLSREALEAFGDDALAREWLLRPNQALGDSPPLDLLDTEVGATAARRILVAISEGGVV
ncbi:MAG: DUF2384 domain-containing protein [Betaproteobacteria bacterium]|nr:DUF2384 domain-containing protein [Betaproteobacteria bacterium]